MRLTRLIFCAGLLAACSHPPADDGRSASQRKTAEKTDEAAKKGALKQKADPAADLKKQKHNLERLEANARDSRAAGNRFGAWTAEWDARSVRKLTAKDEAREESGTKNDTKTGAEVQK
jgi:hypothetical protein